MYYLIIKTTIGRLDLGSLGIKYRTKREAERMAEKAKALPDTLDVWICRTK